MRQSEIIVTCEHGGNLIPQVVKGLFIDKEEHLNSHRGWDPGALKMARKISSVIGCPLFFEEISRLVIDQNRSRANKNLFSEITRSLSTEQKQFIIDEIYEPFHNKVKTQIDNWIRVGKKVFHFSIHSFTPVLNGEVRNADFGLLYDPSRCVEKTLCNRIALSLNSEINEIRIRRNYPYTGISDGFTRMLRKIHSKEKYCGIEIETNQFHVENKTAIWESLLDRLPAVIDKEVVEI